MPGVQNWQTSPLHFVDQIFAKNNVVVIPPSNDVGTRALNDRLKDSFKQVSNFFQDKVEPTKWSTIPSLNDVPVDDLYDGQIVRFRGMIQDVCETEMYLARFEVRDLKTGMVRIETGRYRETATIGKRDELIFDATKTIKMERRPFILVTVPGETDWCREEYKKMGWSGHQTSKSHARRGAIVSISATKRSFVPEDNGVMEVDQGIQDSKRCKVESEYASSASCDVTDEKMELEDVCQKDDEEEVSSEISKMDEPESKTVVCKIYESPDDVNLNDVVEVIGILALDCTDDGTFFASMSRKLSIASNDTPEDVSTFPKKIPHVHVMKLFQLNHTNPLLPIELSLPLRTQLMQEADSMRHSLHRLLTKALFGDELAADYLLFHLISKIYVRRDRLCLGKLALNIFNLPQGCSYGKKLSQFLQSLLSKAVYFPVTLMSLNDASLVPQTDAHGLRLVGGPLQLSVNTHLLLDETELRNRQLTPQGRENVIFLRKLIDLQKIEYGHRADLDHVDIPCLILSHNSSILSSDIQVLVEPTGAQTPPSDSATIDALFSDLERDLEHLNIRSKLRQYLTVAQQSKYEVPPEMQKFIQSEIVRTRRLRRENSFASDELHTLLILSRFMILGRGQTDLTKAAWEEAKCLETRRKSRFDRPGRIL